MAKKETAKNVAATVASIAADKIAADVLKQNPEINEVHITSDGTAFYTRNDAQNHANSLQNREVFSTKRGVSAAKVAATKPKGNTSEANVDELTGEAINDEPAKTDE